ncbi:hypothetical protein KSP40_PGU007180 [Platanthera guangdongensis]|uniref:Uncharacterized protein n=1 Tax=Platanthera guangdongensis TaxID=2320717 RepID=A0ABR2MYW0_9ASPA
MDQKHYLEMERSGAVVAVASITKRIGARNNITRFAYNIAIRVEQCEEARKYVMNGLKDISLFADAILEKNCTNYHVDKVNPLLKDPPRLKPKGICNARLKDHWEKPSKLLNQLLLCF